MKKTYISPKQKIVEINEEELLCSSPFSPSMDDDGVHLSGGPSGDDGPEGGEAEVRGGDVWEEW